MMAKIEIIGSEPSNPPQKVLRLLISEISMIIIVDSTIFVR